MTGVQTCALPIYPDGNLVGTYLYDSWGKLLGIYDANGNKTDNPILVENPFRYRCYYYDNETGLYYLQSRYYDPVVCRFINEDSLLGANQDMLSYNIFAYCSNNPITFHDPTGHYCCPCGIPGCGTSSWNTSYPEPDVDIIIDITDKLNNAMIANEEILVEFREEHSYFETGLFFASKVNTGQEWDLKSSQEWNLDPNIVYLYNGTELRYDDIGNIHYGYVGRSVFSENLLLSMGGAVQIIAGNSKWKFSNSNFDDPRDQWAISFGVDLWEKGGIK